jgi:hypothetical protein
MHTRAVEAQFKEPPKEKLVVAVEIDRLAVINRVSEQIEVQPLSVRVQSTKRPTVALFANVLDENIATNVFGWASGVERLNAVLTNRFDVPTRDDMLPRRIAFLVAVGT